MKPKKKTRKKINKNKELSPLQRIFCVEYMVDLNAKQASIRAGYSNKNADQQGHTLLRIPKVAKRIQELMDRRSKKIEITAEKVLQEIAKMSFANMDDYIIIHADGTASVDLSKLTRDQAAALSEVTVDSYFDKTLDKKGKEKGKTVKKIRIKLADKKGNLELLGKHLKLFNEKFEVTGDLVINYGHRRKVEEDDG